MHCPLCQHTQVNFYHQDKKREYFQCEQCDLVFVPAQFYLSAEDEKAQYDLHENDVNDEGYRRFINRTLAPLLERVSPSDIGLDFGCGPGPVLSVMASELGYRVENYDLYYANNPALLEKQYGFITMTEVIEHLATPTKIINSLHRMLVPSGTLAIMTKRVSTHDAFKKWHYIHDPTHICFYSEKTFDWLANKYNFTLEVIDKDVVFLTKRL